MHAAHFQLRTKLDGCHDVNAQRAAGARRVSRSSQSFFGIVVLYDPDILQAILDELLHDGAGRLLAVRSDNEDIAVLVYTMNFKPASFQCFLHGLH